MPKESNTQEFLKEIEKLKQEIKTLKNRKKYGLVWEDKPEQVVLDCENKLPILREVKNKAVITDKNRPVNILIEGDNYHSLSVLNYTHKEKIDVIYIDPPYNTGASNWKYNNDYVDKEDVYRHSKWLSMMKHRLVLAKKLLKSDGVLICAIDDNELSHLNVLIEEIFMSYEQHIITIIHNPKGVQGNNFSYTHEYAIFVIPRNTKTIVDRQLEEDEIYISNLRNWGNESLRSDAKNCFYPIIISNDKVIGFGEVADNKYHPKSSNEKNKKNEVYIWPIDEKGIERKWRYARQTIEEIKDILQLKKSKNGLLQVLIAKDYGTLKTVWTNKLYDASEYGTKLLRKILPGCDFDFPKSLYTVYDCIYATVGNRKNALILDFFAGSGTTGHAVLELNKNKGGNHKFILCTNNENKICEEVTYPRIKKVISGFKEIKGNKIFGLGGNLKYYKTDFVDTEHINKISDDSKIKLTYQAGEMIALRENTLEELEKNNWWQIFTDGKRQTAIYFKEDKSKLQNLVSKLIKSDNQIILYIFSWGKNEYRNEFSDNKNIRVEDIPEPILEVYKEINKL